MKGYRIGVLNDVHGPWNDEKATKLCLDVLKDIEVDEIILNGDILDFYNINAHGPKHPDIRQNLDDEIDWGIEFFSNLRKQFPDIPILFIFGNHEWRLGRFIMNNCPTFWNMLRLEKMLNLESLNIRYIPYNDAHRIGKTKLFVQHSPPSYSENAAMTSLKKKLNGSFIYGCTHRLDYAVKTDVFGEYQEVFMNGWLGSTTATNEHKKVYGYAKGHENWQQGFSIVTITECNQYDVQQVKIKRDQKSKKVWCSVDGSIYSE